MAAGMEHVTLFLSRGPTGYGFTLTGSAPAKVGRVEPGSPGAVAGLERGDHVVRVNGVLVAQLDMAGVAARVRTANAGHQLVLDVHRFQHTVTTPTNTHSSSRCVSTTLASSDVINMDDFVRLRFKAGSEGQSSSGFASWGDEADTDVYSESGESDLTSYSTEAMPTVLAPWRRVPHTSPWQLYHQLKQQQATMATDCHSCRHIGPYAPADVDSDYSVYTDTESYLSDSTSCLSDSTSCLTGSTISLDKENLPHSKMMRFSHSPPLSYVSTHAQTTDPRCGVNKTKPQQAPKPRGLSMRGPVEPVNKASSSHTSSSSGRCSSSDAESSDAAPSRPPRHATSRARTERAPTPPESVPTTNDSQLSEDSGLDMASQLPLSYHALCRDELERQKVARCLLESEARFCDDLRHGLARFVRPLARPGAGSVQGDTQGVDGCGGGVLTRQQHQTLFRNIAQIFRSSENLIGCLKDNQIPYCDVTIDQKLRHIDNVGHVLSVRIDEICQEYETYCCGLRESLTLLSSLKKLRDFEQYVNQLTQGSRLKMSSFLQRPVEHLKSLTLTVQRLYSLTPARHADYESLQETVRALRRCSTSVTTEYTRQSQLSLASSSVLNCAAVKDTNQSQTADIKPLVVSKAKQGSHDLVTGSSSETLSQHSSSSAHSGQNTSAHARDSAMIRTVPRTESTNHRTELGNSTTSVATTRSVDSEVQDIQNRLLFSSSSPSASCPGGVSECKPFTLTAASRHVIYTGDMQYRHKDEWIQAHVILLTDVLLLTCRGEDNFLSVLHAPILLRDVRACQPADNPKGAELKLKVECHHCEPLGFEPSYHDFRCASLEQRCVWKSLIEQRVAVSTSQKQLTAARVAELV